MSSVLVTGGTGTFGRAFIRAALASGQYGRVIAYSRDEVKQAQLADEFSYAPELRTFLGDVRDEHRLRMAMRGVDVVVHAAALKRVDAAAYSPSESILTNVVGTMNVVNAAIETGVGRVVVVSSDKAVAPTNMYGATKYVAETYAVQANAYANHGGTRIVAVRYGNVLGSRGSVVHIWRRQMELGQPVTITDRRMTRFIMTIEQAVDLVRYALLHGHGGEVFLPVLPSANMTTLAEAVCGEDYPQHVTGLRPGGEKLAEWLLNAEEATRAYRHGNNLMLAPSRHDWVSPASASWRALARVPEDFEYRSDRNDVWLTADTLRQALAMTEALR